MDGKAFKCRPGECVKCCTHPGLLIPVTLGDLYRNWVYERNNGSRMATLYNVFEELCGGFTPLEAFNRPDRAVLAIRSKIPARVWTWAICAAASTAR